MNKELPKGWLVMEKTIYDGPDVRFVYIPYMYGKQIERKGLFRRKVVVEGWHPRGPEYRFEEDAIYYIELTAKAREGLSDD